MAYIVYINGHKRKINSQMMLEYYQRRQDENPSYYKVVHLPEKPKKQLNLPPYKTHSTVETYASVLFVFLIFLAILAILASLVMK